MEQKLHELLDEDETLLWSGRPEPFTTMDKTNKSSILIGLFIKFAVTLFFLLYYIKATSAGAGVKPGVIIFILAVGGYALANPFFVARRLREKTLYGLSDRRLLRAGAMNEAVPYDRMKNVVLRTDADGHTSLLCGPRTQDFKPTLWRGEADAAFINGPDDDEVLRAIMYALPKDKKLETLLRRYLPIDK